MPSTSLSVLLYLLSTLDRLLLANAMGLSMLLSGVLSFGKFVPFLVCSRTARSPVQDDLAGFYHKISYTYLLLLLILSCQIVPGLLHSRSILFCLMSAVLVIQIYLQC